MKHSHFVHFFLGFVLLSVSFVLFSCKKDNPAPAPVSPGEDPGEVVEGFEHLTAVSVVLKGKFQDASVTEYGFLYEDGLTGIMSEVVAQGADEQHHYSLALTGLKPAVPYSFQSYYRLDGKRYVGERMTFTTKELSTLLETLAASGIKESAARLNGRLDEGLPYAATTLEYGFKWGKSDASLDNKIVCDKLEKNAFSALLSGLFPSSRYYFKAYVNVDGREYEGEVKTFTTDDAQDLSSSATANCYIVSSAGGYKFKTVQGNSSTSVGGVSQAEVLWESFGTSTVPSQGDLISAVSYSGDYITFITPTPMKNGNAVIAAKDEGGNILWSWHIWLCDGYNPALVGFSQAYNNDAGTMMDRNLGATSAEPGAGSLGLLYQWGRKDPFLGGDGASPTTPARSTLAWPLPVASDNQNGTIEYAVAHPTTFITCITANYDWYYTEGSSTEDTRWAWTKTKYDPCPLGWKVPLGGITGVWSTAAGNHEEISGYPFDNTNKGVNFFGKFGAASTIWYPASGCLGFADGSLDKVGSVGYWWSCVTDFRYAYILTIKDTGDVRPSELIDRASGFSVRCVQEE